MGVVGLTVTDPVETRPWRECPFIRGRRYRVRKSFEALRDSFLADEILTFDSDAWSRSDGITAYLFQQTGQEKLRVWDIDDDANILIWRELFDELPNAIEAGN